VSFNSKYLFSNFNHVNLTFFLFNFQFRFIKQKKKEEIYTMQAERIFSAEQIKVPTDLPNILRDFSKEVIRHQPKDIAKFGMYNCIITFSGKDKTSLDGLPGKVVNHQFPITNHQFPKIFKKFERATGPHIPTFFS
jgi:hypothetical protein